MIRGRQGHQMCLHVTFSMDIFRKRVYAHEPCTIIELKGTITEKMKSTEQDMLTQDADYFLQRLQACIK